MSIIIDGNSKLKQFITNIITNKNIEQQLITNLTINGCDTILHFPEIFGKLSGLTTLRIVSCHNLKLLFLTESIGNLLPALTKLSINQCDALTNLPESISNFYALTTFQMQGQAPARRFI